MPHNVCGNERILRAVLGVVIIALGVYFNSLWGAIGFIPLATAIIGYCPVNKAFHFSSCPIEL
jgi:hypothetical protein